MWELRQYTLKPGRRDDLVAVFEREFVESQEAEGMCLLGTFRDLDRDDRFVWVRGFRDMDERLTALTSFYGGPVWKENGAEANDTMVDVDDVLLLRPVGAVALPAPIESPRSVTVGIAHVDDRDREALARDLAAGASRADWTAAFTTLGAANTFPALPIREDADVAVVIAVGGELTAGDEFVRLEPTPRSRLR